MKEYISLGKTTLVDKGLLYGISGASAVAVFVINFLMKFAIRKFSLGEMHDTQTKMNVSVAFKLTIARFVNSSLVLVAVNSNATTWFNEGDLINDAFILIMILAFQAPAMDFLYIPGWVKRLKKCREKMKGDDCKMN